ncbi:MAG: hypothetical protein JW940_00055 [Polyangiaceae bacterium]|nr:hypothetical protein [Polyangiaceae bacterium]
MDGAKLLEKLRLIEALFAGATTDGERIAAGEARRRIQLKLEAFAKEDPPTEYRFRLDDIWSRKLFVALCRRYEVRTYRYRGQRKSSLMAKVSNRFVDETLWPEFQQLSSVLKSYLDEITERLISEAIHKDTSEAPEIAEPSQPPEVGT